MQQKNAKLGLQDKNDIELMEVMMTVLMEYSQHEVSVIWTEELDTLLLPSNVAENVRHRYAGWRHRQSSNCTIFSHSTTH